MFVYQLILCNNEYWTFQEDLSKVQAEITGVLNPIWYHSQLRLNIMELCKKYTINAQQCTEFVFDLFSSYCYTAKKAVLQI